MDELERTQRWSTWRAKCKKFTDMSFAELRMTGEFRRVLRFAVDLAFDSVRIASEYPALSYDASIGTQSQRDRLVELLVDGGDVQSAFPSSVVMTDINDDEKEFEFGGVRFRIEFLSTSDAKSPFSGVFASVDNFCMLHSCDTTLKSFAAVRITQIDHTDVVSKLDSINDEFKDDVSALTHAAYETMMVRSFSRLPMDSIAYPLMDMQYTVNDPRRFAQHRKLLFDTPGVPVPLATATSLRDRIVPVVGVDRFQTTVEIDPSTDTHGAYDAVATDARLLGGRCNMVKDLAADTQPKFVDGLETAGSFNECIFRILLSVFNLRLVQSTHDVIFRHGIINSLGPPRISMIPASIPVHVCVERLFDEDHACTMNRLCILACVLWRWTCFNDNLWERHRASITRRLYHELSDQCTISRCNSHTPSVASSWIASNKYLKIADALVGFLWHKCKRQPLLPTGDPLYVLLPHIRSVQTKHGNGRLVAMKIPADLRHDAVEVIYRELCHRRNVYQKREPKNGPWYFVVRPPSN